MPNDNEYCNITKMDFVNIHWSPVKCLNLQSTVTLLKYRLVSIKIFCVKLVSSSHYPIMFMYNCGHPA